MEVSEIRRRLRAAIDAARKGAVERRARSDQAARDYEQFLRECAVPVFQTAASALIAEGYRFKVFTPADVVRLAVDSSADDYIELMLDPSVDPPRVLGRTSRGRGRRQITSERPIKENAAIADLTSEDVLAFVVEEIIPFVER
jgi:hypothetical protein